MVKTNHKSGPLPLHRVRKLANANVVAFGNDVESCHDFWTRCVYRSVSSFLMSYEHDSRELRIFVSTTFGINQNRTGQDQ